MFSSSQAPFLAIAATTNVPTASTLIFVCSPRHQFQTQLSVSAPPLDCHRPHYPPTLRSQVNCLPKRCEMFCWTADGGGKGRQW